MNFYRAWLKPRFFLITSTAPMGRWRHSNRFDNTPKSSPSWAGEIGPKSCSCWGRCAACGCNPMSLPTIPASRIFSDLLTCFDIFATFIIHYYPISGCGSLSVARLWFDTCASWWFVPGTFQKLESVARYPCMRSKLRVAACTGLAR